ncbi:MAG TPA: hypothetical protein PKY05_18980, partial [Fibrobacteria bacterium]|nr:hypothetical protein [Fibrobacteria bacterium]
SLAVIAQMPVKSEYEYEKRRMVTNAISHLENQDILARLAQDEKKGTKIQVAAVERLKNKDILRSISNRDWPGYDGYQIKSAAESRMRDLD